MELTLVPPPPQRPQLSESASLAEVFWYLEETPLAVLLFVDDGSFCASYLAQPWVRVVAQPVLIDGEILDSFQINHVPQFRIYRRGAEIQRLVGTLPEPDVRIAIAKRSRQRPISPLSKNPGEFDHD